MKKKLIAVVVLAIISTSIITTYAKDQVIIKLNENVLKMPDAQPFIDSNNRTQVPVRFVSEALGAKVQWENKTKIVTIKKGSDVISLKIGESLAKKNNNEIYFDTILMLKQNRTFVPLRFVSEALGAEVSWDDKTRTVLIVTEKKIPEDYKKISEVVPNAKVDENGILYSSDGNPEVENNDFSIAKDRYGDDIGISLNKYDDGTLNLIKKVLKIYYPSSYEKVFTLLVETTKNNKENDKVYFDNRSFYAKKFNDGTFIYIGKLGVK